VRQISEKLALEQVQNKAYLDLSDFEDFED